VANLRVDGAYVRIRNMSDAVPSYRDLLWPTLQAVIAIGGSGRIDEINGTVVERQRYSEAQQSVLHGDGPQTEIGYRLAWARTYLKGMGLLDNSARGVWSVTGAGRRAREEELVDLHDDYLRRARKRSRQRRRQRTSQQTEPPLDQDAEQDDGEGDWKDELLDVVLNAPPDRFERLAQRLLREAGFINTVVTGKTGDGGIDGTGTYRLSLISFTVFFQCKRYAGSVGAGAVRDFRGAMTGRGDKGLLITTGTFTADAKQEATRDGAPPIDLIDGGALCELLKQYELGVRTKLRQVEQVEVLRDFFVQI
jgi:restriction system protein